MKTQTQNSPTPRVIDPGIVAIHAEAKARVKEHRDAVASGKLLARITDKQLPKLTQSDKDKLFDLLKNVATPALLVPASERVDA